MNDYHDPIRHTDAIELQHVRDLMRRYESVIHQLHDLYRGGQWEKMGQVFTEHCAARAKTPTHGGRGHV